MALAAIRSKVMVMWSIIHLFSVATIVLWGGGLVFIIALKAPGRNCTNKNELLHKIGVLQRFAM